MRVSWKYAMLIECRADLAVSAYFRSSALCAKHDAKKLAQITFH